MHGTRVSPELLVWAVSALAEGLGIRAVARVFEVDPNTVLHWLIGCRPRRGFFNSCLHDVQVSQVQLDELFAVLSAVKAGRSARLRPSSAYHAPRIGSGLRSIRSANCC